MLRFHTAGITSEMASSFNTMLPYNPCSSMCKVNSEPGQETVVFAVVVVVFGGFIDRARFSCNRISYTRCGRVI